MENNTIEKLSEAITQLMDAYEKLQDKHNILKEDNHNLNDKISKLEDEKINLESNINNLSAKKEQQSSKMSTMLDKIESILKKPITRTLNQEIKQKDDKTVIQAELPNLSNININKSEYLSTNDIDNVADFTNIKHKSSSKSDIDLGRMANLLKGM
jgi:chromosome segregation ATPase